MSEVVLNATVNDLIKEVQQIHPGKIEFSYLDKSVGYLRHNQAQQYLADGHIKVDVYDQTAPNYTVSHELLHFILMFKGTPRISFNLTSGDRKLDEQLMITATELYDSVLHFVVYQQQRDRGLIDNQIEELYFKGVLATLKPEPEGTTDQWMVLRTLTLFDTLVFFKDQLEVIIPKLEELYPNSLRAAQQLYAEATKKEIKTAFAMRRAVVKVWQLFDEQLQSWGLMKMHLNEFATLTAVLSERQSRLEVQQLFGIYHSTFQDNLHFKDAYIGKFKSDGQNTFIFSEKNMDKKKQFADIYAMQTGTYLKQTGYPYLTR